MNLLDKQIKDWFASDITDAIKGGICSPKEIAHSYIDFVRTTDSGIDAWEQFEESVILKDIDEGINQKGSLAGVPLAVKDVFNTKDYMTQMGSDIWKGFTPGNNARVIDHILWEGAFIAGKTVTAEFAVHHPGKTKNPVNADYIVGTSSSGSAAVVSSGMSPIALGTQTAGSTIRPSSYTGIFGFKPTFGLIPRTGILKTLDTLDHVCLMAKTAKDIETCLQAARVRGTNHPFVNKTLDKDIKENKSIRIAFVKTATWKHTKDYTKEALQSFISELSKYQEITIQELELGEELDLIHENHNLIYEKALSYYFKQEIEHHPDQISEIFKEMTDRGQEISTKTYHEGLRKQVNDIKIFDNMMLDYNFIITNSTSGIAPAIGDQQEPPDPCLIWTYLHAPSINIPLFNGPNEMPFGLQLVGSRYSDLQLIRMAEYIEERFIR